MYYEDVPSHNDDKGFHDRKKHEMKSDFKRKDEKVTFMDARRYNRELIGAMGVENIWGKSPARALDDSSEDGDSSEEKKASKKSRKDKKKKSKKSKSSKK